MVTLVGDIWSKIGNIGIDTLSYGIPYAILAIGIFISFRILDFADLTCEGSFTLGGAITAVLCFSGVNPFISLLASIISGMLAGVITGVLHTKLKIPAILSGIITLSGLFTINMIIMGIAKDNFNFLESFNTFVNIPFDNRFYSKLNTSLSSVFSWFKPKYAAVILLVLILVAISAIIYYFFGTEVGMSLRATGINKAMSRAQGIDTDFMIILGLSISNGLIALAGGLFSQVSGVSASTNGTGMLVVGLASIIIGEAICGKKDFKRNLIAVIVGTVIYYLITDIIIMTGILGSHFLKLLYAIIIVIVLSVSNLKTKKAKINKGDLNHA